MGTNAIAAELETRPATVTKWRVRFARLGIEGLKDAPRPGQPRRYLPDDEKRVLKMLDQPVPSGYAQWNGPLLAQATKLSTDFVWRVLRSHGIQLQRRRSWCISTDPEFAQKAADVVGLYLDPPENALVLCVDEKPHIQALERAQGYLRMPNGRALRGFSHEYKRHGTSTLFAALETATGQVIAGHYQRRRRVEFLDFMNRVVSAHPAREIHVIVDNLSTHKPKRDLWLAEHKNVHFHFIPTHASWLNQVEVWFSLLARYALRGASFTSPKELREAIDRFIAAYNPKAHPFEWTKRVVHPVPPKARYADLGN
jgi:transposase